MLYKTGKTIKVRMVEVINPPITTVAKGRCTSAPAEVDKAMGRKPIEATEAVIITGLNLMFTPINTRFVILFMPSFFN